MMRQLLLSLALLAVSLTGHSQSSHDLDVAKNLEIFTSIYKNLDLMYVDSLDANEVVGTGIDAMLASLDPYTEYYPESETKNLDRLLTGKYAGIGALVRYHQQWKRVVIDEPYEGMPSVEAGLQKGDIILAIDKEDMTEKDVAYVSDHLRGEPGTTFLLKIKRPSTGKTMNKKITRRQIQLPYLPYYGMREQGVGYINLNQFTENAARDVRRAVIDLKRQGMQRLVLDLRGNGGGSLQEAISIVNLFVPKGVTLVTQKGKLEATNHSYKTTVEPIDSVMPIVVLVNGSTASSSEITAGSLQDLDRAVVLGTRTYGKGLVQMPIDLPYNAQLKFTTSKYFIPSGRCVQAINYKHSRGGRAELVADSLTHEFRTRAGRIVRDGSGITPDVELKPDSLPNIAYYLAGARDSNEVMLGYEIDYIAAHPTISPAASFELTDHDYAEFSQRVLASGFKYDRETERYMKDLEKLARFEGYYDDAKPEFEALRKKLTHNVERDLERNKDAIKHLIEADIVAAYHFQAGAIENGLRYDKQMKEAVRLLLNEAEYKKLLSPEK